MGPMLLRAGVENLTDWNLPKEVYGLAIAYELVSGGALHAVDDFAGNPGSQSVGVLVSMLMADTTRR